jgi:hypothetical protein
MIGKYPSWRYVNETMSERRRKCIRSVVLIKVQENGGRNLLEERKTWDPWRTLWNLNKRLSPPGGVTSAGEGVASEAD